MTQSSIKQTLIITFQVLDFRFDYYLRAVPIFILKGGWSPFYFVTPVPLVIFFWYHPPPLDFWGYFDPPPLDKKIYFNPLPPDIPCTTTPEPPGQIDM